MKLKRVVALALAGVMVFSLGACGGGGNEGGGESGGGGGDAEQLSGTIYVPEFLEWDLDLGYINSGWCGGQ